MQLALTEDDATITARKVNKPHIFSLWTSFQETNHTHIQVFNVQEKEIAAAALAECQRTILALGKQLKVLGVHEHCELALAAPASPDSIEKMTHTMEFLRSQADFAANQLGSPGTRLTWAPRSSARPALPNPHGPSLPFEQSEETPSSPASPMRVLRSVRTIRGAAAVRNLEHNMEGGTSLESRSTTSFRRFYSRSQSETSMSSDHSNPGPV